jgi:hypothetical protein
MYSSDRKKTSDYNLNDLNSVNFKKIISKITEDLVASIRINL